MSIAQDLLRKMIQFSIQQEKRGTLNIDDVVARALPRLEHILLFHELWTERQVTEKYRFSQRMLRNMRFHGRGPTYTKVSGKVFYRGKDLLAWLDNGEPSRWRSKE